MQLSWRRRRIPVAERTRRQKVMAYVAGVWDVSAWAFVALLTVVAVSRRVGGTAPTLLQPLQAVVPLLFLPARVQYIHLSTAQTLHLTQELLSQRHLLVHGA